MPCPTRPHGRFLGRRIAGGERRIAHAPDAPPVVGALDLRRVRRPSPRPRFSRASSRSPRATAGGLGSIPPGGRGITWMGAATPPPAAMARLSVTAPASGSGATARRPTASVSMSDVTRILSAIEQGDPEAAERLLPLVYDELRRLA